MIDNLILFFLKSFIIIHEKWILSTKRKLLIILKIPCKILLKRLLGSRTWKFHLLITIEAFRNHTWTRINVSTMKDPSNHSIYIFGKHCIQSDCGIKIRKSLRQFMRFRWMRRKYFHFILTSLINPNDLDGKIWGRKIIIYFWENVWESWLFGISYANEQGTAGPWKNLAIELQQKAPKIIFICYMYTYI